MGIEVTGADELARRLAFVRTKTPAAIARALFAEGEEIMNNSKSNFVPVDLGVLRGSGRVHPPEIGPSVVSVTLSYGGAASAYAVAVHETPSAHDPPTWKITPPHFTVGGPKYLERPVNIAAPDIPKNVGRRLFEGWK